VRRRIGQVFVRFEVADFNASELSPLIDEDQLARRVARWRVTVAFPMLGVTLLDVPRTESGTLNFIVDDS
jgi:hypothetical protein